MSPETYDIVILGGAEFQLSLTFKSRAPQADLLAFGAGYAVGDGVALTNGVLLVVSAVTLSGGITAATIINLGPNLTDGSTSAPLAQASTTGAGSGVSVQIRWSQLEDLTGRTFEAHVRRDRNAASVVTAASTDNGRIVATSPGQLTIYLSEDDTDRLPSSANVWGLSETTDGGMLPKIEGACEIKKAIVR